MRAARSDSSAMRRRSCASSAARPGARRPLAQLLFEQLRVADDARQRVVQLVRDAGDELADRRQLLRLEQLRLRRLQLLERRDSRPLAAASSSLICCSRRARADLLGDVLRHLHDRRRRRRRRPSGTS